MSESQYAVVKDDLITNVVVMDQVTAEEFTRLKVYGSAELVSMASLPSGAGLGWSRSTGSWAAPALSTNPAPVTPAPPPGVPQEGTERVATLADDDPLTLRLDDGTTYVAPQVVRHAGYSPVAGDSVEARWTQGAWIVRDAVVSTAS